MPLVKEKKLVYRFLSKGHALDFLQTGQLRVGRLRELNDPLDCEPVFVDLDGKIVNAESDESLSNILNTIGIVCYSGGVTDPVLWTHYADAHRGIALGFEFDGNAGLFDVGYRDERPTLNIAVLEQLKKRGEGEGDALLKLISDGFAVKAKSWKYEDEYRHFIYLHFGVTMIGPNYFRKVAAHQLKRVVLGVRCELTVFDARQAVKKLLRNSRGSVEIIKASKDPRSFLIRA